MKVIKEKRVKLRAKRTFLKQGTCSRTFFYILNREFGHPMINEEQAIDPLAGGIQQQGYQCGMLWGSSMALGAESFRREKNNGQAIGLTIKATRHIMDSFADRTKSIECQDITETDFSNKWSFAKYMFTGKFYSCFKLAEKWAPEALTAAKEGLELDVSNLPGKPVSCASEALKKMGATNEEMVLVSGFAGGLGLSGNGCGALAAVIWKTNLELIRKGNYKASLANPIIEKTINKFYEVTDYNMECSKITGKQFNSLNEHSEFINSGGCEKLMDVLVGKE